METSKNLGIWMDHSVANLIDLNSKKNSHSISSNFTNEAKEDALNRSESLMQNKEQQKHEAYFKKVATEILKYEHVLLFGPTNAKTELSNYLYDDLHFKKIVIDVVSADQMTDNQKDAFVKNHFNM